MNFAQIKNLLKIAIENPAVAERPLVLSPGAQYLKLLNRLQHQASQEHADPIAIKAVVVLCAKIDLIGTAFPRTLFQRKPAMLLEHGLN